MPISGALGPVLFRTVAAMGTVLSLEVRDLQPGADALAASEAAFSSVTQAERRLSTWSRDSELSRLNHAGASRSAGISPALARDLRFAERCREISGDAFHPGLGTLIQAWQLRTGKPVRPSAETLQAALAASRDRDHADFAYEEGGFAKGIALDDAATRLRTLGVREATLNFGGQVLALGDARSRTEVRLAHPSDRARDALAIELTGPGSVSTSGNSERGAHILDPATGELLAGWGSMTVISPSAAWADCLSTALFVMGPERASEWQKLHPEHQFIALKPVARSARGAPAPVRALASCGLKGRLRALEPGAVSIKFQCPNRPSATLQKANKKKRSIT